MLTAEPTTTLDQLHDEWMRKSKIMDSAAGNLAYDVTFRAENPRGPGHSPASPTLTARLKAEYKAAHAAEREAYEAWAAAHEENRDADR